MLPCFWSKNNVQFIFNVARRFPIDIRLFFLLLYGPIGIVLLVVRLAIYLQLQLAISILPNQLGVIRRLVSNVSASNIAIMIGMWRKPADKLSYFPCNIGSYYRVCRLYAASWFIPLEIRSYHRLTVLAILIDGYHNFI